MNEQESLYLEEFEVRKIHNSIATFITVFIILPIFLYIAVLIPSGLFLHLSVVNESTQTISVKVLRKNKEERAFYIKPKESVKIDNAFIKSNTYTIDIRTLYNRRICILQTDSRMYSPWIFQETLTIKIPDMKAWDIFRKWNEERMKVEYLDKKVKENNQE